MTGYATGQGAGAGAQWRWELRGVNGKGLDLRFRLPDWIDGLEPALRRAIDAGNLARGSITVSLRVQSEASDGAPKLSEAALDRVLQAIARVEARAAVDGLSLTPPTSAQIVGLRGVLDTVQDDPDIDALRAAILQSFGPVLEEFVAMRLSEGAALARILAQHLDEIAALAARAREAAEARLPAQRERLRTQVARLLETTDAVEEGRLAQELALIAVKADVTEELDRLEAHVDAARTLLETDGAVGRKFDFLMQEFNREANTLCSKAQSGELTGIGLELKTAIDRMREQVQNVE